MYAPSVVQRTVAGLVVEGLGELQHAARGVGGPVVLLELFQRLAHEVWVLLEQVAVAVEAAVVVELLQTRAVKAGSGACAQVGGVRVGHVEGGAEGALQVALVDEAHGSHLWLDFREG